MPVGVAYPGSVDALGTLAEIIRTLITKISTLFDVIDLSFFVSGGTCALAFVYMRYVYVGTLPDLSGALAFAVAVIGSYVMGLLCFSIGRWLRRLFLGRLWSVDIATHMANRLGSHGLDLDELMRSYLAGGPARKDALYPRLWTEIRQDATLKPSFELLASYWVRTAAYDGLVTALMIWALALWRTLYQPRGFLSQPEIGYGALIFVGLGIIACAREASRSERYQVDEITATMAYAADKRRREAILAQITQSATVKDATDAIAKDAKDVKDAGIAKGAEVAKLAEVKAAPVIEALKAEPPAALPAAPEIPALPEEGTRTSKASAPAAEAEEKAISPSIRRS